MRSWCWDALRLQATGSSDNREARPSFRMSTFGNGNGSSEPGTDSADVKTVEYLPLTQSSDASNQSSAMDVFRYCHRTCVHRSRAEYFSIPSTRKGSHPSQSEYMASQAGTSFGSKGNRYIARSLRDRYSVRISVSALLS